MKRFWAWGALIFGLLYFFLPLIGMTNFSLKMRRGEYSFDAYGKVLADPRFIIAAIAAPSGMPLFRWQAEAPVRQERGVSLIGWQNAMHDPIANLLPGSIVLCSIY